MPSKHSILGPSAHSRWSVCPASPTKSAEHPGTTSRAAVEGTIVHNISEMILKGKFKDIDPKKYWIGQEIQLEGETITVSPNNYDCAVFYVDYVKQRTAELEGTLLIEEQVEVSEIHEALWGTSDAIIIGKDRIAVIDYKNGRWNVEAVGNSQLKIYGLGACAKYCDDPDTIIELTIVQPNSPGKKPKIKTVETTAEILVDWGYRVLKPQAEACFEDEPKFVAGEHCRFCNYKPYCEKNKHYESKMRGGYDEKN